MGLPAIDESLQHLLAAFESMPSFMGSTMGMAKSIGCAIALCVGSYECWMMMLGRRGMDVMKILRIIGFSLCITLSGYICSMASTPGKMLEQSALQEVESSNKMVAALELKVAEKQGEYLKKLRQAQDSLNNASKLANLGENPSTWEEIKWNLQNLGTSINNLAQQATVAVETKITEWINDIVRFLGQLFFQMTYYGILVAQRIFMAIMAAFCPLMFALSLAPAFSNAWSQWLSKYISLSLWGWCVYVVMNYVNYLLQYNLEADITAYDTLLGGNVTSWENIGALGMQGIGSNCMYVMGMLVGAFILKSVPEVASWLIPGGVSSSAGHAAGGLVTTAGVAVGGAVIGGAQATAGFVSNQSQKALTTAPML